MQESRLVELEGQLLRLRTAQALAANTPTDAPVTTPTEWGAVVAFPVAVVANHGSWPLDVEREPGVFATGVTAVTVTALIGTDRRDITNDDYVPAFCVTGTFYVGVGVEPADVPEATYGFAVVDGDVHTTAEDVRDANPAKEGTPHWIDQLPTSTCVPASPPRRLRAQVARTIVDGEFALAALIRGWTPLIHRVVGHSAAATAIRPSLSSADLVQEASIKVMTEMRRYASARRQRAGISTVLNRSINNMIKSQLSKALGVSDEGAQIQQLCAMHPSWVTLTDLEFSWVAAREAAATTQAKTYRHLDSKSAYTQARIDLVEMMEAGTAVLLPHDRRDEAKGLRAQGLVVICPRHSANNVGQYRVREIQMGSLDATPDKRGRSLYDTWGYIDRGYTDIDDKVAVGDLFTRRGVGSDETLTWLIRHGTLTDGHMLPWEDVVKAVNFANSVNTTDPNTTLNVVRRTTTKLATDAALYADLRGITVIEATKILTERANNTTLATTAGTPAVTVGHHDLTETQVRSLYARADALLRHPAGTAVRRAVANDDVALAVT